jgi:hypothetical protein
MVPVFCSIGARTSTAHKLFIGWVQPARAGPNSYSRLSSSTKLPGNNTIMLAAGSARVAYDITANPLDEEDEDRSPADATR